MTMDNQRSVITKAASEEDARLTTLDPGAGYVTTMNTYTVAPERAEEVLNYLVRSAVESVRYVPGFVSMNFHLSLDRTQIVNYGQWKSREAMAAARKPQNLSADERDRQNRGRFEADPVRTAAIRAGSHRVNGNCFHRKSSKKKRRTRRKTCQGKTSGF